MQKTNTSDLQTRMNQQMESKEIFRQVVDYAFDYVDDARQRNVAPQPEAIQQLTAFEEPLPEEGGNPAAILELLHQKGSPATVAQMGGRYFGFVNGGSIPTALAARWLADFWDQNAALYVMSPLVATLEKITEGWLNQLLGFSPETAVGFVSGTSMANVCALAAARHALLIRRGWDVYSQGLFGAPPIRVILGREAHSSIFKGLALLGLGSSQVEWVAADEQGRMIADDLPVLDDTCLVIAQAGNVNSGAFDPFSEICEKAKAAGAWVHVDGAFGLWAAASTTHQHLTVGIAEADSWAVDAHKTLNIPYDSGLVFCRHRDALLAALRASASYLQLSDEREGMMYTTDMSRRGRVTELWAALKFLGRKGVNELINSLHLRAVQFARELEAEGFEIPNEVVFNQVLVTCETDEQTTNTLANIQRLGECWCGGANWKGRAVIRISVCSWVTTEEDVSRSVQAFVKARAAVVSV